MIHISIDTESVLARMVNLQLAICLLLPTVFGCSCVYPAEYSTPLESLCEDFQWSDDVFAGRVISASCNCIPPLNDTSYGQANISCLSSSISEYFTSEIVAGATCDAGFQGYGILSQSCDRLLNSFKPTGKFLSVTFTIEMYVLWSVHMKAKCIWIVPRTVRRHAQARAWRLLASSHQPV